MKKTIYLPEYAKEQLETNDNSSVWAKPIPFSETASNGYSLKYVFDPEDPDDNDGIDPTKDGMFYPEFTDPDTTLERLIKVKIPKKKRKDSTPKFQKSRDAYAAQKEEKYAKSDEFEEDKTETIPKKDLESLLKNVRPSITVKGPALLYTSIPSYEVFFDGKGKLITYVHENDAEFRPEYLASLFKHFNISVQHFKLPDKLESVAESLLSYSAKLEGQTDSDPEATVIDHILLPYLKLAINSKK